MTPYFPDEPISFRFRLTRKQLVEHARRDAIQACVLLVSARFGDAAGEWLLAEMMKGVNEND